MPELENANEPSRYQKYADEIIEDITNTIQEFGCQPILFCGSGLSKRYINAPSWDELLSHLSEKCSTIDKGLAFYKQSLGSNISIGQEFARLYQEWAWGAGNNEFPKEMFNDGVGAQSYLKYKIAEYLTSITPEKVDYFNEDHINEIEALIKIKPHAVITTNYDTMLEKLFPELEPIVGQKILKGQPISIGEIFKIHGCVTEYDSIVFTHDDYQEFINKKKFLSAKLLTFFNEHPLLFIGYAATDPNIQAILSDIDEVLPEKGGIIPNVFILQWDPNINADSWPQREKVIATEAGRNVRIKMIVASDFEWVFDAFAANPALANVNTRTLRALIARSYELVRNDIPKMTVEADFEMLKSATESQESFAKLFGIANINDYSQAGAQHPFCLTEVSKQLGKKTWHFANDLIKNVEKEKGINIKSSDNRYHRGEKINKMTFHKYSPDAVELLKKVRDGQEYELDLGIPQINN